MLLNAAWEFTTTHENSPLNGTYACTYNIITTFPTLTRKERSAELNVTEPCVDLAQIMELAILSENVLFDSPDLGVFSRQELK